MKRSYKAAAALAAALALGITATAFAHPQAKAGMQHGKMGGMQREKMGDMHGCANEKDAKVPQQDAPTHTH